MSSETLNATTPQILGGDATTPASEAPPRSERTLSLREELLAFLDQLELRSPARPAAVQLVGPRGGEGTSTITGELARCAASRGSAVLLVRYPGAGPEPVAAPPAERLNDLEQLETVVLALCASRQRGRPAELVLGSAAAAALRDSRPERDRLVRATRERFQLVLIDAPPVLAGNDSVLLAPSADSVVLIVEAEATRRPVAQAAVERLRDTGATLAGLLFNKRRHHIPESVYRLL